jgi:hypothetical protein
MRIMAGSFPEILIAHNQNNKPDGSKLPQPPPAPPEFGG